MGRADEEMEGGGDEEMACVCGFSDAPRSASNQLAAICLRVSSGTKQEYKHCKSHRNMKATWLTSVDRAAAEPPLNY